ncbi:hypothetical protein [Thermaerobacillus caldiproteolyticus]|uniref:Uncharacterized protein n=1 Tax=Thermaerobacillus caldiproteolyticus TaxID=247480 RepID=A0A7V9ZAA0_9BACL|nr:hypothetical protein [Anoxybacillus caldiproteolyticus]MBA2876883.1 hypothetical protein [Anoxybacillus caldiproteolyticus]
MRSGNIEQFKHLSQFRDLKDFNNNIEQWMIDLKSKFTKLFIFGCIAFFIIMKMVKFHLPMIVRKTKSEILVVH